MGVNSLNLLLSDRNGYILIFNNLSFIFNVTMCMLGIVTDVLIN